MSKYLIIDGVEYPVQIAELKRRANILDKYAYRSEDGILHREVIGTYYNYDLKVGIEHNKALYNQLFEVLSDPVDCHQVCLPHDGVSYKAYCSSVEDTVLRIENDGTLFKGLSCKFTAMEPRKLGGKSTATKSNLAGFDSTDTLNS